MKSDRFIIPIIMLFCLVILGGMALKGLMYWWMPLLFAFVCMAIYAECNEGEFLKEDWRENHNQAKISREQLEMLIDDAKAVLDKSDYKAMYNPPEETLSSCNKCNNEVYEVCMCKPVVNE